MEAFCCNHFHFAIWRVSILIYWPCCCNSFTLIAIWQFGKRRTALKTHSPVTLMKNRFQVKSLRLLFFSSSQHWDCQTIPTANRSLGQSNGKKRRKKTLQSLLIWDKSSEWKRLIKRTKVKSLVAFVHPLFFSISFACFGTKLSPAMK